MKSARLTTYFTFLPFKLFQKSFLNEIPWAQNNFQKYSYKSKLESIITSEWVQQGLNYEHLVRGSERHRSSGIVDGSVIGQVNWCV